MDIHVSRWGNSLGLRIPKILADSMDIRPGDAVTIEPVHDGFVVRKSSAVRSYSLEELLAGITEDNRHPEVAWGPPTGGEAW